ncbi:MAG: hypothetical protein FJ263_00290 [Planctomycetes bacterium]|nr:hypothetical protein [Planctomycetota bacterium]
MPWFENIVNFACECMFFVGNVLADISIQVQDFVGRVREAVRPNITQMQDIERKLQDVNLSIEDLLRKNNRDTGLSTQDKKRLNELKSKREQLKKDIWSVKEQETLRTVANNEKVYTKIITPQPQHLHIVQYHVGQTVSGKRCPKCGKEMMLRINNDTQRPFWGCVDYFSLPGSPPKCKGNEPYRLSDHRLFFPTEIPEFEISNAEFTEIYSDRGIQNGVARRMKEYQNVAANEYFCPTHGERLILREKREFEGALDQFFLACPRWNLEDHSISCRYKMKIKTPAQLAAVLKNYDRKRGIL